MDCHRAVGVDFFQEFDVHIFYPLLFKRGQYCMGLHSVEGFLVVDECEKEWDIIFSALRGCGLSLSICFRIQLTLVAGFR